MTGTRHEPDATDLPREATDQADVRKDPVAKAREPLATGKEEARLRKDPSRGRIDPSSKRIKGLLRVIDRCARQINGLIEQINGLVEQIAGLIEQIAGLAAQIVGPAAKINGYAKQIDGLTWQIDGFRAVLAPFRFLVGRRNRNDGLARLRIARSTVVALTPQSVRRRKERKFDMSELEIIPSPHADAAKALVDQIRAVRAAIPRFTPEGPKDAQSLAATASLNEQFLEAASVLIQKSPMLEGVSTMNTATLRDSFAFALAYEAALTEANALVRALAHTVRLARATAGTCALDIYAFAQRLAKRKDGAELIPHVQDMRRKLRRGRRKATSEPAPEQSVKTAPK